MKYLKIENSGHLDVRLITLMGGTTKAKDNTKIGEFGTGLKYSVGYMMREGIDLKIFVGTKEVVFGTVTKEIAGHNFDIVTVDGKETELTTSVGRDWSGWMICREIWCNAIDEGGYSRDITTDVSGTEGKTTFYLQYTGEIKETVDNWADYFTDKKPLCGNDGSGLVYQGCGHLRIYKQGILVYKDTKKKSLYNYDFPHCSINELREYKNTWEIAWKIERAIASLDNTQVEYFLSEINDEHYESSLDYEMTSFNESWVDTLGQAKIIKQDDLTAFKNRGVQIDEDSLVVVPDGIFTQLATKSPALSAVRRADKVNSFIETYDEELNTSIKAAKIILEECGYYIDPELVWITGHFGKGDTLARINIDDKTVMVSERMKGLGRFDMVTMMVEENEHFRTQYEDCSRNFQQHFINLYVKEMLRANQVNV